MVSTRTVICRVVTVGNSSRISIDQRQVRLLWRRARDDARAPPPQRACEAPRLSAERVQAGQARGVAKGTYGNHTAMNAPEGGYGE